MRLTAKEGAKMGLFLFAVFTLTFGSTSAFGLTPTSAAQADWRAHPTFHVRPFATSSPTGLSPTQIRSAYNLPSSGGHQTIAVADAFDDPTVASDLSAFSSQFGLPAPNFEEHQMSAGIAVDQGWALEISLDVQWAHAIAPAAKVLLVEASSNSLADLLTAVDYARSRSDVVAVSMSWGGSEFLGETIYDSYFTSSFGASFFASSGDSGAGVIWPAASGNVVAVGGTTLTFSGGVFSSETAWSGSGGGVSVYETEPGYQVSYGVSVANGNRAVPDVSYDADPNSGVSVFDSTPYQSSTGWWKVGGTSAGAPQWAAIHSLGLSVFHSYLYQDAKSAQYSSFLRDITSGSNGHPATVGYDLVTGLGSPLTTSFTPPPSPDFSISAAPTGLTIAAGSSGTSTITVSSLGGFTGSVSLTASAPAGITGALNPTGVTVSSGGSSTSTLTVSVASSASAGTYSVTVKGASGSITHSATVTITVTTQANPDFSMSASPSSLSIKPGRTGTSTITVSSLGGFSGSVSFSATAPTGITVTFSQTTVTLSPGSSATSVLTVTVSSTVKSGTYYVTVTGVGGSTHSVVIKITVPGGHH